MATSLGSRAALAALLPWITTKRQLKQGADVPRAPFGELPKCG
jgi:hypothetical protein